MRSPTRPAPPPHAVHRAWGVLLLVALVLLGIARSHLGTRLDSFTIDEPWHIVAGTSYVRSGDFRLNPEHPPLAKLWVGAAMADDFKLRPTPALAEKLQERDLVEETMFYDNDPARAQRIARIAMWSLHGLLLLTLGLLLWHALGLPWAAGSLAFLAIEPTVAAHLPVVMTDLPLALALLVAAVCGGLLASQWRWRGSPASRRWRPRRRCGRCAGDRRALHSPALANWRWPGCSESRCCGRNTDSSSTPARAGPTDSTAACPTRSPTSAVPAGAGASPLQTARTCSREATCGGWPTPCARASRDAASASTWSGAGSMTARHRGPAGR